MKKIKVIDNEETRERSRMLNEFMPFMTIAAKELFTANENERKKFTERILHCAEEWLKNKVS